MKRGDENEFERNLRLEKVVASKQLKFAMETDVERKARLEKMVATTQLRVALETEEERREKKGMNLNDIKNFLPARTCEQGNVIGLVSIYICVCVQNCFVIERTRDLIYLKFVATDFFPKIISPSAGETPVTQRSHCYSAVSSSF